MAPNIEIPTYRGWYASSVLEKDLMVSLTLWRLELDWNMATEKSPLFQETVLWEGARMECGSPEWELVSLGVVRISVGLCGRPHGHWGPWMMPFDPTNRKDTSGTCSQDREGITSLHPFPQPYIQLPAGWPTSRFVNDFVSKNSKKKFNCFYSDQWGEIGWLNGTGRKLCYI